MLFTVPPFPSPQSGPQCFQSEQSAPPPRRSVAFHSEDLPPRAICVRRTTLSTATGKLSKSTPRLPVVCFARPRCNIAGRGGNTGFTSCEITRVHESETYTSDVLRYPYADSPLLLQVSGASSQSSMASFSHSQSHFVKLERNPCSDNISRLTSVVIPAICIASINAWRLWDEHWEHKAHEPPLEEKTEYPYQNIRNKKFPWGDGDKVRESNFPPNTKNS